MKVTVYVQWGENRILTEKDFSEEVTAETLDRFEDSDFFDEWLSRNFDPSEVFSFTESEKETQRARFKEYCAEEAKEILLEDYEIIELEI